MGALGKREKPSETKREAARRNARAPRPGARRAASAGEEGTLRESLVALRMLSPQAVEILKAAMVCGEPAVCVRAAEAVLDRSGIPRVQQQLIELNPSPPKLFELSEFAPPSNWTGDAAIAEVVVGDAHALPPVSANGDTLPLPEVHEREAVRERRATALPLRVAEAVETSETWRDCVECGAPRLVDAGRRESCDVCGRVDAYAR